jgi:deoxyribonuclease-4
MPLFGAHMSIAGGYYKALQAAHAHGCETVQLFTKNTPDWRLRIPTRSAVFAGRN